jgi:hypothetical protein
MMGIGTKPAFVHTDIGGFDVKIPDEEDIVRIEASPDLLGEHSQETRFAFFIEQDPFFRQDPFARSDLACDPFQGGRNPRPENEFLIEDTFHPAIV